MKRLLQLFPAAAVLIGANLLAPQPAFAFPTCEQEISIRCSGHDVQGRGRLDIYYDSYAECVAAETPAQCGASLSFNPPDSRLETQAVPPRFNAKG
jgi:hypothetical protein